jgi:hypothetical protein
MAKNLQEREDELFVEMEQASTERAMVNVQARADAENLRHEIVLYLANKKRHANVWAEGATVTIKIGEREFAVTAIRDDLWSVPHDSVNRDDMLAAVLKFIYREFGMHGLFDE